MGSGAEARRKEHISPFPKSQPFLSVCVVLESLCCACIVRKPPGAEQNLLVRNKQPKPCCVINRGRVWVCKLLFVLWAAPGASQVFACGMLWILGTLVLGSLLRVG